VAIFVQQKLTVELQFRLGTRCSSNQAEQLVFVKTLEAIETIDIPVNSPRTIDIFTYSRITLDLLQNANNHNYLIEEIRKTLFHLDRANWTIGISCGKGIPTNTLYSELKEVVVQKWQTDWDKCSKADITRVLPKSNIH
jgi:hypothetical protein